MASLYMTKALKFITRDGKQPEIVLTPLNYLTNHSSQRRSEMLINFGLSLFGQAEYKQAFKCFETVSTSLSNPRVWFLMGVSIVKHISSLLTQ